MSSPRVSGRDVVRALGTLGFSFVSQKGSHAKLRNNEGRTVIVPLHPEIATGTLRSIVRQAGISMTDFVALL